MKEDPHNVLVFIICHLCNSDIDYDINPQAPHTHSPQNIQGKI